MGCAYKERQPALLEDLVLLVSRDFLTLVLIPMCSTAVTCIIEPCAGIFS